MEKLGVGDSEGGPCIDTNFDVELDGYRQALVQAKSLAAVDTSHVFVFGHSIGGLEGPMLASEGAPVPRISGVAVLSTVGISWYEYELANLRRQLELDQTRPDSLESEMRLKAICGYRLLIERASRADILGREPRCESHIQYPASDAYMQAVAERAPAEIWRNVSAPALVMYGTSDFITSRDEHQQLVVYINAMHPGNATFADVANLDHYLSRQASQLTSFKDSVPGLSRPYYGATLEPILEHWLDSLSAVAVR